MADGKLSCAQVEQFNTDGYLILENFLSDNEVQKLRDRMKDIVGHMDFSDNPKIVFSTVKQTDDDYFMTSGDKIRAFFEDGVFDDQGKLLVDRHLSINKIGHALHALDPAFKQLTFSKKIQNVAKSIGFKQPVIPQSMYIFKQPNIGGKEGVKMYMILNPLYGKEPGEHASKFTADLPQVDCDDKDFIPVAVKKGTMVLIHGEVIHKSETNVSTKSRHIYTFHVVESENTEWSKENWLQPTEELPFPYLYTE